MKDRFKLFIKEKGISQRRFERDIGVSNGYINNITNSISTDVLLKTKTAFPELNTNWLLKGEGLMLSEGLDRKARIHEVFNHLRSKGLVHTQKDLAKIVESTPSNISRAMNGDEEYLTNRLLLRVNKAFDNIFNEGWLLKGEGNMLTHATSAPSIEYPYLRMIPIVSQYEQYIYSAKFADNRYINSLPKIPFLINPQLSSNYICFEAKGNSMFDGSADSILPGDQLICRELNVSNCRDSLLVNKKHIFIIIIDNRGILTKRITHINNNGLLTTHSINPMYEDAFISIEDIKQLFQVVQIQRKRNI